MSIGIFSSTFGGKIPLNGHSESHSISDTGTHHWIRALHLLNNMPRVCLESVLMESRTGNGEESRRER